MTQPAKSAPMRVDLEWFRDGVGYAVPVSMIGGKVVHVGHAICLADMDEDEREALIARIDDTERRGVRRPGGPGPAS